jgi:hypothetical protein
MLPGDKWICLDRKQRPRTGYFDTQQAAVAAGTNFLLGIGMAVSIEPVLGVVLVRGGPAPGDDELAGPFPPRHLKFGELRVDGTAVDYVALPFPDNTTRRDTDLFPSFVPVAPVVPVVRVGRNLTINPGSDLAATLLAYDVSGLAPGSTFARVVGVTGLFSLDTAGGSSPNSDAGIYASSEGGLLWFNF